MVDDDGRLYKPLSPLMWPQLNLVLNWFIMGQVNMNLYLSSQTGAFWKFLRALYNIIVGYNSWPRLRVLQSTALPCCMLHIKLSVVYILILLF